MTLRERLEEVWRTPRIASPSRRVAWHEEVKGYGTFGEAGLWWTPGTMVPLRGLRRRRIGSYLRQGHRDEWRKRQCCSSLT